MKHKHQKIKAILNNYYNLLIKGKTAACYFGIGWGRTAINKEVYFPYSNSDHIARLRYLFDGNGDTTNINHIKKIILEFNESAYPYNDLGRVVVESEPLFLLAVDFFEKSQSLKNFSEENFDRSINDFISEFKIDYWREERDEMARLSANC